MKPGANHLPDWTILKPVFADGALVAFACNRAHQSDIGGGAAGTYNSAATEIYHEGIRLPVLRLVEAGETREDLWKLLLLNSRTAHLLDGDLRAMIGSTNFGANRVIELVSRLGRAEARAYFAAVLDHGEAMMRAAIEALPDGRFVGIDVSDNDCFGPAEVGIEACLTIRGDEIEVDLSGSSPQIRGFKNSSFANTHSAVYMALLATLDTSIPRNGGTFRPIRIVAPEGTVVNAKPPAPMTNNTVHVTSEIIHAIWKAFAEIDPALACAGWGKTCHCISSGLGDDERTYVMYHWHGQCGGGAVAERDGFGTVGQLCTLGGMMLPNVEAHERKYPVTIHRHEFRADCGGAGKFRGGTGMHYAATVHREAQYAFRGEGTRNPTGFGTCGGRDGAKGDIRMRLDDGTPVDLPQYGVLTLPPPLEVEVDSAAGGGWGDPRKRAVARVVRDVEDGIVSVEAARDVYGLVLDPTTLEIDETATAQLREKQGSRREAT